MNKFSYQLEVNSIDDNIELQIKKLESSRRNERLQAALFLGSIGERKAVKPLCQALLKESDWLVRIGIILALGKLKDKWAIENLLLILREDSLYVRLAALWALGEIKDKRCVSYISSLLDSEEPQIRKEAEKILTKILYSEYSK